MMTLKGTAPIHIWSLLLRGDTARVELVTSKGTYVDLHGQKILLCSSEFGIVPNGISIDGRVVLCQNQEILCKDGKLILPDLEIQVFAANNDTTICTADYKAALQALKNDPGTGFGLLVTDGSLPPECQIAKPLLENLYAAILDYDRTVMEHCVLSLLGLGKGLTPSGDDVLAGLLYGLRHSMLRNTNAAVALCGIVRNYAHKRTNAVSADYLIAITIDAPFARLKNAFDCPQKLIEIGSNSGRELLLGRIMAAKLIKFMDKESV